ncbi:MAG: hypothetical protein OEW11_07820 [Nitrospirota bacterium]|nr:hypothetical protein [Nitrospirota bacterium]
MKPLDNILSPPPGEIEAAAAPDPADIAVSAGDLPVDTVPPELAVDDYVGQSEPQATPQDVQQVTPQNPRQPPRQNTESPPAAVPDLTRRLLDARLDQAEAVARSRYPDFDAKVQVFARLAAVDPALLARLHTHTDPAEYAYRLGGTALEAGRGALPATTPLPESLSGTLSAARADTAPWRPKTLFEILGDTRNHG